jgi:hypothetical protein
MAVWEAVKGPNMFHVRRGASSWYWPRTSWAWAVAAGNRINRIKIKRRAGRRDRILEGNVIFCIITVLLTPL